MAQKYKISSPDEASHNLHSDNLYSKGNCLDLHRFDVVSHFIPYSSMSHKLLDFGCGDGSFLGYLSEHCYSMSLAGYDPFLQNDECKSVSTKAGGSVEIYNSLEQLPKHGFDFISALDVVEHIENDRSALLQINSLLKIDGTFLMIVPAYQFTYSLWDAAVGHYRRYTKRSAVKLLSETGFLVQHATYFFSFLIPFAILRKYYLRLRRMWRKDHYLDISPGYVDTFKLLIFLEFKLMKKTSFRLPCGTSIFVQARKLRDL